MPDYELLLAGRVKERFTSNIDPKDDDAVISLLRRKARENHLDLSRAVLRLKGSRKTYSAK